MPTNKKRINLALPTDMTKELEQIAKRDSVPTATKVAELLGVALELEEDIALGMIAARRDTKDATYVSHDDIWR